MRGGGDAIGIRSNSGGGVGGGCMVERVKRVELRNKC